MTAVCVECGATNANRSEVCKVCGATPPEIAAPGPVRRRLSIPFGAIVVIGLVGALVAGGGKPAIGRPASEDPKIMASIDGKPATLGGPALALLEQQTGGATLKQSHLSHH